MIKYLNEDEFNLILKEEGVFMVCASASWCSPCKALDPILEKVAAEATFKVFKVDVDDYPEVSKSLGIRGVPTVIVFKNGKVAKQHVGLTTKDALIKLGSD